MRLALESQGMEEGIVLLREEVAHGTAGHTMPSSSSSSRSLLFLEMAVSGEWVNPFFLLFFKKENNM